MQKLISLVLGSPRDWHLRRPWIRAPKISLHWLGPLAMLASVVAGWFAFAGTAGLDSNTIFSFWVGSTSIVLMAWSFVLALRIRIFEKFWGGLDSMYRGHRWAGALAVVFMFLHTQIEPETKGGDVIRGASANAADAAEELAETGELMIYGLIGLSLIRLIPYRWWRWTHKLFGIPFAFASWHFFTATKPYANSSGWGMWFGAFMLAGIAAWVARVFVRDTVGQGSSYTVIAAETGGNLTRIELEPKGSSLTFESGQFAFLRLDESGMREPHPFSIASGPNEENLTFYIRHLGDWSDRLPSVDLIGKTVKIEGPYGEFDPLGDASEPAVWIAGGVGLTPFLSALDDLRTTGAKQPTVLYACKSADGDPLVDLLTEAADANLINLHLFASPNRLTPAALGSLFPAGLGGHHVALCGPEALVNSMAAASHDLGARSIETEGFDIRQGFGPDRSREIADVQEKVLNRS